MVLIGVGVEILACDFVLHLWPGGGVILHHFVPQERRDHVKTEPVNAAIPPAAHLGRNCILHAGAAQVQARLLRQKLAVVILPPLMVPVPCGQPELRQPIVGRAAIGLGIAPQVMVGLALVPRNRILEPRALVAGVVQHLVQINLQPKVMRFGDHSVKIVQSAKHRVYVTVIDDVIATVDHGRHIDWRQPNRIHAKVCNLIQPPRNSRQIAGPAAIGILKRTRVNLIDCRGFIMLQRSCLHSDAGSDL